MMYDMDLMGPSGGRSGWWSSSWSAPRAWPPWRVSEPPRHRCVAPPEDDPVELLRHRLANGEIDDEDYLRRRSALGDS